MSKNTPRPSTSTGAGQSPGTMRKAAPGNSAASSTTNQAGQPPMNKSNTVKLPPIPTITGNQELAKKVRENKRKVRAALNKIQADKREAVIEAKKLNKEIQRTAREAKAAQIRKDKPTADKLNKQLAAQKEQRKAEAHKRAGLTQAENARIEKIQRSDAALNTLNARVAGLRQMKSGKPVPAPKPVTTKLNRVDSHTGYRKPVVTPTPTVPNPIQAAQAATKPVTSSQPPMPNTTVLKGGATITNAAQGTPRITPVNTAPPQLYAIAKQTILAAMERKLSGAAIHRYSNVTAQTLAAVQARGLTVQVNGQPVDAIQALAVPLLAPDQWWQQMKYYFNEGEKFPYHGFAPMAR